MYLEEEHQQYFEVTPDRNQAVQMLLMEVHVEDRAAVEVVVPFTINKFFKYLFLNQDLLDKHQYKIKVCSQRYKVESNFIKNP